MLPSAVGNDESIAAFGAAVLALRKQRGMTQEDLARRAKVGVTTLSNLENSHRVRMHDSTKRRIAEALGVRLEDLDSHALGEQVAAKALTVEQRAAIQDVLTLGPEAVALFRETLAELRRRKKSRK